MEQRVWDKEHKEQKNGAVGLREKAVRMVRSKGQKASSAFCPLLSVLSSMTSAEFKTKEAKDKNLVITLLTLN